jgi:replicative DNA helicase
MSEPEKTDPTEVQQNENHHVEMSLVAAAMSGPDAVEYIRSQIGNAPFHSAECQSYWLLLQDFERQGMPFDLAAIADEMVRRFGRIAVNGIVDIYQSRWESHHVGYYCGKLLGYRQQEATRQIGEQLSRDKRPDYDHYIASLDRIRERSQADISSAKEAVAEMIGKQQDPAASHRTGIEPLDQLLGGGIKDAQVCIVAGRPGSGKTVLMMQMATGAIAAGDAVLVVSLEMLKGELMERLAKRYTVPQMEQLPMHLIDSTSNLQTILALCKVAHRRHRVGMIVIDYLQLLEVQSGKNSHREEQVATASRAIKRLAMDLKCPIIVGSQLNRAGAENPTLSSLRESGSIEQDASQVILIKDPTEYGEPSKMIVAKNRNGKTGDFAMRLNGACYLFESVGDVSIDDADAEWR